MVSSSVPSTTKQPTIAPDERVEVSCYITFNLTFREEYGNAKSPEFKSLDEQVVPQLAHEYEKYISNNYRSVLTVRFIDAKRLGTQIEYKINLKLTNLKEDEINNKVTSISIEYLEGKTFKVDQKTVRFLKNSFAIKVDNKVEPKEEEKVVILAEFTILCELLCADFNYFSIMQYL